MSVLSVLFQAPPVTVSRGRTVVGLVGVLILAAMVVAHTAALTVFLWDTTTRPSGVAGLAFLWSVSIVALLFLGRFVRHMVGLLRAGSGSQASGLQPPSAS